MALRRDTNCGAHPVKLDSRSQAEDVVPKLSDIVREKFDTGVLPFERPLKLWVGFGNGKLCTVCERPILPVQAEYELRYDDGRTGTRFHLGCYDLWETELRRRGCLPAA